jgi:hypothetical protein
VPAALVRDRTPHPLPPRGTPVRVVFAGPEPTFAAHALHAPAGGIEPRFVDVREGAEPHAVRAAIASARPHVVIALGPAVAALGGDAAATPPLVGDATATTPPAIAAAPIASRRRAVTLAVIGPGAPIPPGFHRTLRTPGAGGAAGAWRSRPLPIDDRLFADVRRSARPPRALFVGRSTAYREAILTPAKHDHDVLHYSHGLAGDALAGVLAAADAGIALTPGDGPGFPAQAPLHLAAGHLLLSQTLQPAYGLEPGIDLLEFDSVDRLQTLLIQLRRRPDAYERVRIRGRLKAEEHRASRVWPRIVHDLLADVGVFGANTLEA